MAKIEKGSKAKVGGTRSLIAAPIHPFLFVVYFVLALVGVNISQMYLRDAWRALIVALGIATILLVLLGWLYKNLTRGAVAASLLLILFFTYGHVYQFLEGAMPALGHHRILLPVWLILGVSGIWLISKRATNVAPLTLALNLAALAALIFPLYQVISWESTQARMHRSSTYNVQGVGTLKLEPGQAAPDVYLVIVDMYARQDLLQEVYGYDNAAFLDSLRQMGFTVVGCSQSNYSQTELALASMLNLNYLDQLGTFDQSTQGKSALRHLIQDNAVMKSFRSLGYQLVSFATGYPFSEFTYADHYLYPADVKAGLLKRLNPFEELLSRSTLGLALSDLGAKLPASTTLNGTQSSETKRQQVLFDLDQLALLPREINGPKFVFAHILALHEPFVFTADGSPVDYPENMSNAQVNAAYIAQLEFINQRLLGVLQAIITQGRIPPVIILQGDTGSGLVSHTGRMENLSALYLPEINQVISPRFTPVNNFRLVFDQYFGAKLGLLEDASYFSSYTAPYDFELIPNTCKP